MRNDKIDPALIKALLGEEEGAWAFLKTIGATILKYLFIAVMVVFGVSFFTAIAYGFGFLMSFWSAYVCMHLWNWFVVPATNLPEIGFFLMMGFNVAIHAIKGYNYKKEKEEDKKEGWEAIREAGKPLLTFGLMYAFALLTGWIIHTYLM